MKKNITLEANTRAAHGGDYLTDTARRLDAVSDPLDKRPEADYRAVVAMDTLGTLQLIWWRNGDPSFLQEDGDNLPPAVIDNWFSQLDAICDEEEIDALYDLRDYVGEVRDKAESVWSIVVCGNNETLFDPRVADEVTNAAFAEIVTPIINELRDDYGVNVRVEQSFGHWNGGPGSRRARAYTDNPALDPFADRLLKAISNAQDKAMTMQTELENSDVE